MILPLLMACAELPAPTVAVSATVQTLAVATWSTSSTERSRVVVSEGGTPWIATAWEDAEPVHQATLLGLHADGEYTAVVEVESGATSPATTFATGGLPVGVDVPTVEGTPSWGGWLLTTMVSGSGTGPLLLDPEGRVSWWAFSPYDGRVTRARFRPDGAGAWYGFVESDSVDHSGLRAVAWDGTELEGIDTPTFSHDFVQRPDGELTWIEYDRRTLEDGRPVSGNRLVEGGPAAQEEVFSTFDLWEPGVDGLVAEDGYWTGVNALDYDPDAEQYTFGSRGLGALVTLDRADGQVRRQIGGPASDYAFAADAELERNHQFHLLEDGVLVHDNRNDQEGSRAVELALDDEAGTASVRWEWQHQPPLYVYALGDVERLADGGTLITWTTSGVIDQVGADDEVVASVSMPLGTVIGFCERLPGLPGMQAP